MNQDTNFSHTEEAFLLSCLREAVNVWARGYGQASFDLAVKQPNQPRRRGPGRRERDRSRAAKHQASHNHKESVSDEVVSDVILPFSGKILPITAALEPPVSKPPLPSLSPASTKTPTTAAAPASRPTPASPAPGAAPTKPSSTPARYIDMNVNNVKKMLFPSSDALQLPRPAPSGKPTFQRREEQLWTKLFK